MKGFSFNQFNSSNLCIINNNNKGCLYGVLSLRATQGVLQKKKKFFFTAVYRKLDTVIPCL